MPERATPVGIVVHANTSVHHHSVTDGAKRGGGGGGMKEGAANMSNVFYDKTYDDRVKRVSTVCTCTQNDS